MVDSVSKNFLLLGQILGALPSSDELEKQDKSTNNSTLSKTDSVELSRTKSLDPALEDSLLKVQVIIEDLEEKLKNSDKDPFRYNSQEKSLMQGELKWLKEFSKIPELALYIHEAFSDYKDNYLTKRYKDEGDFSRELLTLQTLKNAFGKDTLKIYFNAYRKNTNKLPIDELVHSFKAVISIADSIGRHKGQVKAQELLTTGLGLLVNGEKAELKKFTDSLNKEFQYLEKSKNAKDEMAHIQKQFENSGSLTIRQKLELITRHNNFQKEELKIEHERSLEIIQERINNSLSEEEKSELIAYVETLTSAFEIQKKVLDNNQKLHATEGYFKMLKAIEDLSRFSNPNNEDVEKHYQGLGLQSTLITQNIELLSEQKKAYEALQEELESSPTLACSPDGEGNDNPTPVSEIKENLKKDISSSVRALAKSIEASQVALEKAKRQKLEAGATLFEKTEGKDKENYETDYLACKELRLKKEIPDEQERRLADIEKLKRWIFDVDFNSKEFKSLVKNIANKISDEELQKRKITREQHEAEVSEKLKKEIEERRALYERNVKINPRYTGTSGSENNFLQAAWGYSKVISSLEKDLLNGKNPEDVLEIAIQLERNLSTFLSNKKNTNSKSPELYTEVMLRYMDHGSPNKRERVYLFDGASADEINPLFLEKLRPGSEEYHKALQNIVQRVVINKNPEIREVRERAVRLYDKLSPIRDLMNFSQAYSLLEKKESGKVLTKEEYKGLCEFAKDYSRNLTGYEIRISDDASLNNSEKILKNEIRLSGLFKDRGISEKQLNFLQSIVNNKEFKSDLAFLQKNLPRIQKSLGKNSPGAPNNNELEAYIKLISSDISALQSDFSENGNIPQLVKKINDLEPGTNLNCFCHWAKTDGVIIGTATAACVLTTSVIGAPEGLGLWGEVIHATVGGLSMTVGNEVGKELAGLMVKDDEKEMYQSLLLRQTFRGEFDPETWEQFGKDAGRNALFMLAFSMAGKGTGSAINKGATSNSSAWTVKYGVGPTCRALQKIRSFTGKITLEGSKNGVLKFTNQYLQQLSQVGWESLFANDRLHISDNEYVDAGGRFVLGSLAGVWNSMGPVHANVKVPSKDIEISIKPKDGNKIEMNYRIKSEVSVDAKTQKIRMLKELTSVYEIPDSTIRVDESGTVFSFTAKIEGQEVPVEIRPTNEPLSMKNFRAEIGGKLEADYCVRFDEPSSEYTYNPEFFKPDGKLSLLEYLCKQGFVPTEVIKNKSGVPIEFEMQKGNEKFKFRGDDVASTKQVPPPQSDPSPGAKPDGVKPHLGLIIANCALDPKNENFSKVWCEEEFKKLNTDESLSKSDAQKLSALLPNLFSLRYKPMKNPQGTDIVFYAVEEGGRMEDLKWSSLTEGTISDKGDLKKKEVILKLYKSWTETFMLPKEGDAKVAKENLKQKLTQYGVKLIGSENAIQSQCEMVNEIFSLLPEEILTSPEFKHALRGGINLSARTLSDGVLRKEGERGHYNKETGTLNIENNPNLTIRGYLEVIVHETGHVLERSNLTDPNFLSLFKRAQNDMYALPALDFIASSRQEYIGGSPDSRRRALLQQNAKSEFYAETFMHYVLHGESMSKGFKDVPGLVKNHELWQEIYDYYKKNVFCDYEYRVVDGKLTRILEADKQSGKSSELSPN